MAERLSPMNDLFKLVDSCNRCVAPSGQRKNSVQDPTLADFQAKLQLTVEQMEREVKKRKAQTEAKSNADQRQEGTCSESSLQPRPGKVRITMTSPESAGPKERTRVTQQSLDQCLNGLEGLSKMGSA